MTPAGCQRLCGSPVTQTPTNMMQRPTHTFTIALC